MATEIAHGKLGSYTNHKCRCADCREAVRVYMGDWKATRAGLVPDGAHGKASTYTNYGCRCEDCREAKRVVSAESRRRAALRKG